MDLAHLKNNRGARHRVKRLGCGIGSGHGKTSGRGGKGQTARTGSSIRPGFEGGQMPLYRRLPKRGFNSFNLESYAVVSLDTLNEFSEGDVVTPSSLKKRGLLRSFEGGVKVLGGGALTKKLTVVANAFSNSALEKIQAASGACLVATPADARKDYDGVKAMDVAKTKPAKRYVPIPRPVRVFKVAKAPAPKAAAAVEGTEQPEGKAAKVPDQKVKKTTPAKGPEKGEQKKPSKGKA